MVGAAGRRTVGPRRGLPHSATASSHETVWAEPASTTLHPLTPAATVRRELPAGDPAAHWVFREHHAYDVPEQHVLELRDGTLLGKHSAVVTTGGRLDLETSHYFGINGWREHPVYWNPLPRPPEHVAGTVVVLATRGTGHNFFHFMVDALPRIGLLHESFPGLQPDAWVVDHGARYQHDLLEAAGVTGRLVEPGPGMALRADRLLVPSLPNASTLLAPESVAWLRQQYAPPADPALPDRIYVTRGSTPNTRRVVHEPEIVARLQRRGFEVLDPTQHPIREQIARYAAAQVVVAPHGAALTNLAFARPGVRVLELFAPGYVQPAFWSIAMNVPDARYRYLVADGPREQRPGRAPTYFMDDIEVTPDQVDAAVDALLDQE